MNRLPVKANADGMAFSVADFIEAGTATLRLSVVAGGKSLSKTLEHPVASRPGLALTGFYEHFEGGRLQLIGNAEAAYLRSLDPQTRRARIEALFERGTFCVICTNGEAPHPDLTSLAVAHGVVLLTTPLKTRDFVHSSAFVLERLGAPRTTLYGTMVEVAGLGVFIEGDPGLGKSETALGLVKRGCALIADDLTCIRKETSNNLLYGSAADSTAGYMEIRGIGIIHIPSIFGINSVRPEKRLQLVITFKRLKDVREEIDRIGEKRRMRNILGVDVPHVIIPVSEGRDLVNLVETAAQQQRLIMSGYSAVGTLSERLRRHADSILSIETVKRKGRKGNGRRSTDA